MRRFILALPMLILGSMAEVGAADFSLPTGTRTDPTAITYPTTGVVPTVASVPTTDVNGNPTGASPTTFASGTNVLIIATSSISLEPGFSASLGSNFRAVMYNAPTIQTPASASPSVVTGTTSTVSALGADDQGEYLLKYTWISDSVPSGGSVSFAATNGSNAGKSLSATFTRAGVYMLHCTISDTVPLAVSTAVISITVSQTQTTVSGVAPAGATVAPLASQAYTASVADQFGQAIPGVQPIWSVSGGGSIDGSGLFLAASSPGGPFTVTATAGASPPATASVTIQGAAMPLVTIYPVKTETVYPDGTLTSALVTTYDYTFQVVGTQQTNRIATRMTTLPTVASGHNGSGTAVQVAEVYDAYGRLIWTKDGDGFLRYQCFDPATGAVTKTISDVDVSKTADFTSLPSGWSTPIGGGKHLIATRTVDDLGRPLIETDPTGTITYTVHKDPTHEVRVYRAWNISTNRPTLPTILLREDRGLNYQETLTLSTAPSVSGGKPNGTESFLTTDIQSWSRDVLDANYRVQYRDEYVSLTGQTYSATSLEIGAAGTTYYHSQFGYDSRGRQERLVDGTGTIVRTLFDHLSRPVATWKGLSDTGFTPSNPGSMSATATFAYDGLAPLNGVGNGTLTTTSVSADASTNYSSKNAYDFRDRLVGALGPDGILQRRTLDNLGRTIQLDTYAAATAPDIIPAAANLRGRSASLFDENGHAYQSVSYQVDSATDSSPGTVRNSLTTNLWYNGRGAVLKSRSPSGLLSKALFDGLGRTIRVSHSTDGTETSYAAAATLTGDTVIDAAETIYDRASLPVCTTAFHRRETDGSSTGALTTLNAYYTTSINWFDLAHRSVASADYGRDNGSTRYVYAASGALIADLATGLPSEAVGTPRAPGLSVTDYRATATSYDAAGRVYQTKDPGARVMERQYDLLGHVTTLIENRIDGVPTNSEVDSDRTTIFAYNPGGTLLSRTARVPNGSAIVDEITKYFYTSTIDAGWLTNTIYPDSNDMTASGADQVKCTYDRLGRAVTRTDQRGVVHTYRYDAQGRKQSDAATTIPATIVDGAVQRIDWTFDDVSRTKTVSSYASSVAGAGVPLDQVAYVYGNYGQVASSQQSHAGAVVAGSPKVSYAFSDGAISSASRFVRLSSITYPSSSRVEWLLYPASGIGDALNRPDRVAADSVGASVYGQYTYLGAGTTVTLTEPLAGTISRDIAASGYASLDRFGQVISHAWTKSATTIDGTGYSYDILGDRLSRHPAWNGSPTGIDEFAAYDNLNRVTKVNRGTLTLGQIADANSTWQQRWQLDAVGNWKQFSQDLDGAGSGVATAQARLFNNANEIDTNNDHTDTPGDSISGTGVNWIDPLYDAAGDIRSGPVPGSGTVRQHYIWDAWGRLVKICADSATPAPDVPGPVIAQYRYDGLGRRIVVAKTSGATTDDFYYNESDQELEVRRNAGTAAYEQYVWDKDYIDSPLCRYRSTANNGTFDETIVYLPDANHNITAVTDATGTVTERYRYDPYGRRQIYAPDGTTERSQSSFDVRTAFTGRRLDVETGLYYYRARYYDPCLGIFVGRDPAEYIDGSNFYQYVCGSPWNFFDPFGLSADCTWGNWFKSLWSDEAASKYRRADYSRRKENMDYWAQHPQELQNSLSNLRWGFAGVAAAPALVAGIVAAPGIAAATVQTAYRATPFLLSPVGQMAVSSVGAGTLAGAATLADGGSAGSAVNEALKAASLDALFHLIQNAPAIYGSRCAPKASPWSLRPDKRGLAIEQQLGGNLPPGFKTIDRFNGGVATSIKSIDLNAPSYQNGAAVLSKLNGYVDRVAAFKGASLGDVVIDAAQITGRELQVAVPGMGTNAQQAAIAAAAARAQGVGVQVTVTVVP